MRKLEFEVGDSWEVCMGRTRDFVNSQQEAIGELQTEIGVLRDEVFRSPEPADDMPEPTPDKYWGEELPTDTHRTVTLLIPKDMTIGECLYAIWSKSPNGFHWWGLPDTDLQAEIDKIEVSDE